MSTPAITFDDISEDLDPALVPPLDRPGIPLAGLTPEQRSWHDNGIVILPNFLPTTLVDAYVERRAREAASNVWLVGNSYEYIPEMRALGLYPPLRAMLESLFGEPMLLHLALAAWVSTERDWHQDDFLNPPFLAKWYAAVWMALEDINPDSGPFEYIPGSHKWPVMRSDKVQSFLTDEERARREPVTGLNSWPKYAERFTTPAVQDKIATSNLPVRQFLARKGDVLIWHAGLMHRGSLPKIPGTPRRALITHYSALSHRPDMPVHGQDESGGHYAAFDREGTLRPKD